MENIVKKTLYLALALTVLAFAAKADPLMVADDSSSGTYAAMTSQLNQVLGENGGMVSIKNHGGAVGNLEALTSNQCQLAFLHSDVIEYRGKSDGTLKDKYKTLIALYPESVHFVTLNRPVKVGGKEIMGHVVGGNSITLSEVSQLAGLKVGAAGGGYITAKFVQMMGEVSYNVIKYDKGDQVLAALNSGEVQCAIFVGGAPLPNLASLDNNYHLLQIGNVADKVKAYYQTSVITYANIQTESVTTIAPRCLLVARVYKTPKFVAQLAAFRRAFFNHLDEVKETPGMHKAWQDVEKDEKGSWPYYDFK